MTSDVGLPRIAALVTCHNRKALTLAALEALERSARGRACVSVFLVDDGSEDGTGETVVARHPGARVLRGDGSLYWNGGMRRAWKAAREAGPFDFFLWLNDDLALFPDALENLLADHDRLAPTSSGRVIVVGRTRSGDGNISYGGLARAPGLSRLRFRLPQSEIDPLVTMNGNCVLIPAQVAEHLGMNSPAFTHALGDIDYGLRATAAGYLIHQTLQPVGAQEHGPPYGRMSGRGVRALIRFASSPKGMPWREWAVFCFRHGGPLAPVNFAAMYLNQLRSGRNRSTGPDAAT